MARKTLVERALAQLETQIREPRQQFTVSADVRNFFRLRLAGSGREVFSVMFLDAQHAMLECEDLFLGTVDSCTVHPREIAKAALRANAAVVVLAHNHPSGNADPSTSDVAITGRIRTALAMFDIRVLDHIVVSTSEAVSMAERGLL